MSVWKKTAPDWGSRNWDIAASEIRCKADAAGAFVWGFQNECVDNHGLTPLVLAHDEASARAAAQAWVEAKNEEWLKRFSPNDPE